MARRPEHRPGSPPARRRFPILQVAVASGTLLSVGTVVVAWWALREPEATAESAPGTSPALVRSSTASPLAERPAPAPPSGTDPAGPTAETVRPDEDLADDPVSVPDSGGLSRADVVAAINAVRPQVVHCGRDPSQIGLVRMTVASSGKVTAVQVTGRLAGTSAGECVAEVARGVVFRSSRREQTVVSWPIALGRSVSFSLSGAGDEPEADPPAAAP